MKNFKKVSIQTIFLIMFVLLFVVSLQLSSAADHSINDTTTGGIRNAVVNNVSVVSGDTVYLQPGTYNGNNNTNMVINKNLTFKGNSSTNNVIIDAQGLSRIFNIADNTNATFINITFINGNASNGGAIYNSYTGTTMTFINCTFINNQANYGGAIQNSGANMTVSGCNFINNSANSGGMGGGAINNDGANMIITGSNFTNNFASTGGAIHNGGNAYNMSVSSCNFMGNNVTGTGFGGAIYNRANMTDTMATVSGCNFTNNSASTGGSIYTTFGSNMTVSGCNFTDNSASTGGAITAGSGTTTISGCNFTDNSASTGGAIQSTGGSISIVIDSNFIGNSASTGGAIYNYGGNMIIFGSNFINNNANVSGGVIYNRPSTTYIITNMTISGSNFIGNSANVSGGAIYNYGANVDVFNSNFINNNANVSGGVIYNNDSNMSVSGNIMVGNSAGLGQMIYNTGDMGVLNLTYLSNSTVKTSKGSTVLIYATLTDDMGNTVTGQNISFYVDGVFVANVTSIEGKANTTYLVTKGPVSVLPVTGDYAGYDGYSIVLKNGELLVPKIPTKITISVPEEVKVGDTVTLTSKLTDENGNPLVNKTVDFYVDGVKVGSGITDENGIAKLDYTFTKAGKPAITAKFTGDSTYLASNATDQSTVSKIKTNLELETDNETITATLTDEDGNPLANKEIIITVNGQTFIGTTDVNGQVIIKFPNANKYKVTAKFAGDDRYAPSSAMVPGESEPDEPTNETTTDVLAYGKITMKSTGIPIIAILLSLLASMGIIYRRKE